MSSKRAQRRKACGKKRRFADAGSAGGAVAAVARKGGGGQWPMSSYLCRFCRWWHIGHTPRRALQVNLKQLERELT